MRPARRRGILALLATILSVVLVQPVTAPAVAAESRAVIQGSVLGPDGHPLADGEYAYLVLHNSSGGTASLASGESSRTDGAGAYRFTVPPGNYHVEFRYVGGGDVLNEWWGDVYNRRDSAPIAVEADTTTTLDVRLDQAPVITGTMSGAEGQQLSVGYISIDNVTDEWQATNQPTARLSADGTWRTRFATPGEYVLDFSSGEQWAPENHNGLHPWDPGRPGPKLVLRPGETVDLDVILERSTAIEGTAIIESPDGSTRPYTGYVSLWNVGNLTRAADLDHTDEQGGWAFHAIEPGDYYVSFDPWDGWTLGETWENRRSFEDATVVSVARGEVVSGLDAVLQTGGKVTGRLLVREAGGTEPAPSTGTVTVLRLDEASGEYAPVSEWPWSVDASGDFDFSPIRPGTYAVYFTADRDDIGSEYWENARYFAASTDVEIRAGETVDFGDIVLEPRYFDVGRLGGADRFGTAVEISRAAIEDGRRAPVVYIANAYNYPDALAAGPAAIHDGGVVLTVPVDWIPPVVAAELERLRPERIVVAGGPVSVSDAVLAQLARYVDAPSDIDRIGGATRFDTARLLARDAFGAGGARVAFVATAWNFPDALAAGPAAGRLDGPVVLVDGGASRLDAETTALIEDLGITDVYIAGGTATVSAGLESSLSSLLGVDHVVRLAGPDRFATASAINRAVFGSTEFTLLASGWGFPDALAGGPLAGMLGAPIHLSPGGCIPGDAAAHIVDSDTLGVLLLGGEASLSPDVAELAVCG